ncbi:VOC family protein [Arthrobacter methylotrophus]|uniref:VOC family protein n=1 Tax=Arthrobacter methylotrophus TaxID=121291 RepID=A0ABV5UQ55_9MICC
MKLTKSGCRLAAVELISEDVKSSSDFYAWLLGAPAEGGPEAWDAGQRLTEKGIASVRRPETEGPGAGWVPVFHVENAAEAQFRAEAAGGGARDHSSIAGGARNYFIDAAGVWTAITDTELSEEELSLVGQTNVDYGSMDTASAADFYSNVLHLEQFEIVDDPYDFRIIHDDRHIVAGIVKFGGTFAEASRPAWLVYFDVDDVDQTLARAVEAGARIVVPANNSNMNRYAVLRDPYGQVFGLSRYSVGGVDNVRARTATGTVMLTDLVDIGV